jgi:hypothetical protein
MGSHSSGELKSPAGHAIKAIRRRTRRHFSAEDKIRIVLEGLSGEDSISVLCGATRSSHGCRKARCPANGSHGS